MCVSQNFYCAEGFPENFICHPPLASSTASSGKAERLTVSEAQRGKTRITIRFTHLINLVVATFAPG
jgi:hypothetical protein